MKNLFLAVTANLKTVSGIAFIDMNKGQLSGTNRPTLAYPAALINTGTINPNGLMENSNALSLMRATIQVRLVFDSAAARTSAGTPAAAMEQSLAYLDIEEAVYKAFKNFAPGVWDRFSCTERKQEDARTDGLVVMRLTWTSSCFDEE